MILLAGVTSFASGQERTKKTIELKIGLSVTGYILELEDGNYMLETDAGDIVFYSRDEIRSIKNPGESKEVTNNNESNDAALPVKNSIPKMNSLSFLLDYYEIADKLEQYKKYLVVKKKKQAKAIEDKLWTIEKKVKDNDDISESLKKEFVDYVESAEDNIEKEAKKERRRK